MQERPPAPVRRGHRGRSFNLPAYAAARDDDCREDWIGMPALAKELGVTMRTVYKLLDAGDLPAYRFGSVIRIKRDDVAAFLERAKIKPGELRLSTRLVSSATRRGSARRLKPRT